MIEPTITFEEYMAIVWQIIDVVTTIFGYLFDAAMIVLAVLYERRMNFLKSAVISANATFNGSTDIDCKAKMHKKYDLVVTGRTICLRKWWKDKWALPLDQLLNVDCRDTMSGISNVTLYSKDKYISFEIKWGSPEQRDEFIGYLKHSCFKPVE